MSETSKGILKRVNHLQEGGSSRDLYDDWSNNYDTLRLEEFNYMTQLDRPGWLLLAEKI